MCRARYNRSGYLWPTNVVSGGWRVQCRRNPPHELGRTAVVEKLVAELGGGARLRFDHRGARGGERRGFAEIADAIVDFFRQCRDRIMRRLGKAVAFAALRQQFQEAGGLARERDRVAGRHCRKIRAVAGMLDLAPMILIMVLLILMRVLVLR